MSASLMSIGYVWFSFEGRINRQVFWLWYVLPVGVLLIVAVILDFVLGTYYMAGPDMPIGIIHSLFALLSIWIALAAGAKRCHDRNRSGWLQLIYLIPIIGGLFALIYLGFLPGTKGPNRFGPDPLEAGGGDPAPEVG